MPEAIAVSAGVVVPVAGSRRALAMGSTGRRGPG